MFLVYGVIEVLSVMSDQTFGHISDPAQSIAAVPVFAALTLVALVPLGLYMRSVRRWPSPERLGQSYSTSALILRPKRILVPSSTPGCNKNQGGTPL
jgi:hypothetical protein